MRSAHSSLSLIILSLSLFGSLILAFNNCGDYKAVVYQGSAPSELGEDPDRPDDENPQPELPPPPPPTKKQFLYLALNGSNSIEVYSVNSADGKLTMTSRVPVAAGVVPLAIHPNRKFLYAGTSSNRSIAAYSINQTTAALSLDRVVSVGLSPVYIHVDSLAKNLLIPSYSNSAVTVLPLMSDGTLSANTVMQSGFGMNQVISTGVNANSHSAMSSQNSQFVFVANTSANTISQFNFNPNTGQLTPNAAEPQLRAPAGAEPRHVIHHPALDIIYYVNENGDSVSAYSINRNTGRLSLQQTLSTLPAGFNGANNTCADLHITPDAKFLYASNRGHDSLAIFAINQNGQLTALGHQIVTGTPREFEIDQTGRYIYVAGQTVNMLSAYSINRQTGLLTPIERFATNGSPIWVYSLELP